MKQLRPIDHALSNARSKFNTSIMVYIHAKSITSSSVIKKNDVTYFKYINHVHHFR